MTLVKCVKAGIDNYCSVCEHGELHEVYEMLHPMQRCTQWGECNLEDKQIKVRCVKIEEE